MEPPIGTPTPLSHVMIDRKDDAKARVFAKALGDFLPEIEVDDLVQFD